MTMVELHEAAYSYLTSPKVLRMSPAAFSWFREEVTKLARLRGDYTLQPDMFLDADVVCEKDWVGERFCFE